MGEKKDFGEVIRASVDSSVDNMLSIWDVSVEEALKIKKKVFCILEEDNTIWLLELNNIIQNTYKEVTGDKQSVNQDINTEEDSTLSIKSSSLRTKSRNEENPEEALKSFQKNIDRLSWILSTKDIESFIEKSKKVKNTFKLTLSSSIDTIWDLQLHVLNKVKPLLRDHIDNISVKCKWVQKWRTFVVEPLFDKQTIKNLKQRVCWEWSKNTADIKTLAEFISFYNTIKRLEERYKKELREYRAKNEKKWFLKSFLRK